MIRLLRHWRSTLSGRANSGSSSRQRHHQRLRRFNAWQRYSLILLLCVCVGMTLSLVPTTGLAQSDDSLRQEENELIREFTLPRPSSPPPVYRPSPSPAPRSRPAPTSPPATSPSPSPDDTPASESESNPDSNPDTTADNESSDSEINDSLPTYEYILEFNRSPVVGNRLRMEGVYPESRVGFTRPREWKVASAKALLRYQHSPSLLSQRSFLTLQLNNTSVGSISLDRSASEIGEAVFDIPVSLIQDYNELSMVAEQHTSETCTNPSDPSLWTEILPDSKLVFEFQPQPIALDLSLYPYPFIDALSLDPNRLSYLSPDSSSEEWLTSLARFQTSIGRITEFQTIETQVVEDIDELSWGDRLIIIGTPREQPLLSELELPFTVENGQILDGDDQPLPGEVGVLMLTTVQDGSVPVLVISGNAPLGVAKATQDLVQPGDRDIVAGQAAIIDRVSDVPSPDPRDWPGYLPTVNSFQLDDLTVPGGQPFREVTVHGAEAPPVRVNFHALPDDRFSRGSTMTLHYSHSPQVNPRTSTVEVLIDNVAIGSKRLSNRNADAKKTFKVNLPDNLIKPDSILSIRFILNPRESEFCGLTTDEQLWGRVYGDTSFDLKRGNVVRLPDLELLKTGYPLTAPQDLSAAGVVMPDAPTEADIETLLAITQRLGQVSKADSVKLNVYRSGAVPGEVREERHLVAIGRRDRFPLQNVLQTENFSLQDGFTRVWKGSQVHALPDTEGVVRSVLSPQNRDRIILALTAQTDQGLTEVQRLFHDDALFAQLRGDTILISSNNDNPSPYDSLGYSLTVLQEAQQRRIERLDSLSRISLFFQDYWFMLPTGIVILALLLYSISQLYLNRISKSEGA
ncbi:MAG: cellulose biosynthesis cyclic di-GMP-binding regulatory protein BcsB [Elainellaceae cyanobacterium]